jgi:hypothetical protein
MASQGLLKQGLKQVLLKQEEQVPVCRRKGKCLVIYKSWSCLFVEWRHAELRHLNELRLLEFLYCLWAWEV